MHGVQITWKTFSCHHSKLKAPLINEGSGGAKKKLFIVPENLSS